MPLLKRFGAFPGKRLAEEGVAVGQRHDAEHHLDLTTTVDRLRLAEIELGFTRWMGERHEDFGRRLLPPSNLVTNDGDPTRVAVLVAQPIKDSLARVTLLLVDLFVGFENLVNDRNEGPDRRFVSRRRLAVAGWLRVGQNLLNRPKVQIVLLAGFTPAHPVDEHVATDVRPGVHSR